MDNIHLSTLTPFGDTKEMVAEATMLLNEFYPDCAKGIPPQRQKAQWQAENKLGFFMGLINYGIDRCNSI